MVDILIVGGGPAGMTAALYALRNGKSALVIEKEAFGGQITHSPRVENYPGTMQMSGNEFADHLMQQILAQGAQIEFGCVSSIEDLGTCRRVTTTDGETFEARAVILATGARHRMLGLPGEEELVGEGISFCAVCDGDFYTGRHVLVAGGGNSALQEALLLSDKCQSVTILQDLPFLTGEQRLQEALFARTNVRIVTGVRIEGFLTGQNGLRGVRVLYTDADTREEFPCDGLFVAIGLVPENEAFVRQAALDARGYFDSDERCMTRTPFVFVAGDCRAKTVRQLTTAIGDGATAAIAACRALSEAG